MYHFNIISTEATATDIGIALGGAFFVLLIAYLVTRFTKYGGGSDYGMSGEGRKTIDDDWDAGDFG